MSERWLGIVVGADALRVVDAEVPDGSDEPIIIHADHLWPIQKGDRASAYCVMHQHVAGYAQENGIARAIIKASALSQRGIKKGHLEACELRGVVMSALAGVTTTECRSKAHVSRTYGKRKADEYLADDDFWAAKVTGNNLRSGSREAALVILAARKADAA